MALSNTSADNIHRLKGSYVTWEITCFDPKMTVGGQFVLDSASDLKELERTALILL